MRAWRVLDRGRVPEGGERLFAYRCDACSEHGLLPVLGQPARQSGPWITFESERHAVPALIECAYCEARFGLGAEAAPVPPSVSPRSRRHLNAVATATEAPSGLR